MTLSIQKLQELLNSRGFVVKRFFTLEKACFYVELFSISTCDIFMLYIPSKYVLIPEKNEDVYKMKEINFEIHENETDKYVEKKEYEEDAGMGLEYDNMEEQLENAYKHQIKITDISKDDSIGIKSIIRQLKRLSYSVENLKYKVMITFKNYICALRRDNSISCFSLKNTDRENVKKLFILIDLEMLVEKNDKIMEDILSVKDSIYNILEKNQSNHGLVLEKILENKKDIISIPKYVDIKRAEYNSLLTESLNMLQIMIEKENKILKEIQDINKRKGTLQSDIMKTHTKTTLEKELDKISVIKEKIGKTIIELREKKENCILNIDELMFDNTVMVDLIIKNFSKLKDFC
jgi:hypothetical protein